MEYGIICLLPIIVVIVTAVISRRAFEPLALGSIVGYIILEKTNFFIPWVNAYTGVIADNAWYWILFFLFGSVVKLLTDCGGALGFTAAGAKLANSRPKALMITWVLGIAIFIDDFLNNLAIGTAMKGITDRLGISRHLLSYVINSTGACVCVLVPVSTWAVFMQGLYEQEGVLVNGTGLGAFIAAIPYMWYPWAVILCVPLVIFGILPVIGPMRKEEELAKRAAEEMKQLENCDEEAHQKRLARIEQIATANAETEEEKALIINALTDAREKTKASNPLNFIIPLLVITLVTIFQGDMVVGILIGLVVMAVMYIPQKLMTLGEFLDKAVSGACDMMIVNCLVSAYFCLQSANDQLGVAEYVIDLIYPILNASTLPLASFVVVSVLCFATGSFWGMPAVAFPILIPLANMYGCNPLVVGAAIVSAGAFGSSACFYGDAVTCICSSAEIKNYDYARTVIPMLAYPAVIAILIYIGYAIFV